MRHRNSGRKLGRKSPQREALRRHVVCALFTHGRIETTVPKAKEFRPWAESLITTAKRGAAAKGASGGNVRLNAIRRLVSALHDETVAMKLVNEIGPRFADRPGGYTRILKKAMPRLGDRAPVAIFELVDFDAEGDAAAKASARAERDAKRKARAGGALPTES